MSIFENFFCTPQETGTYGWVNGWPVLFSAWGENEPSGGTGEGCVMSTTEGRWDDTLCTSLKPFICKYDEGKLSTNAGVDFTKS